MTFCSFSQLWYRGPLAQRDSPRSRCDEKRGKLDIEEEYKNTFRTKSYVNMMRQFQKQLKYTEEEEEGPLVPRVGLTGYSLGPGLEYLLPAGDQALLCDLLRDYLDSGFKAWSFCCLLLKSVGAARANLRVVRTFLTHHGSPTGQRTAEQRWCMVSELACVARLDNPLSQPALVRFPGTRGVYGHLIPQLRSLQSRIARRAGFVGFGSKASGLALSTSEEQRRRCGLAQLGARLDEAARGAYALDRELDTVGRTLARLNDEEEHVRGVVRAFLQGGPGRYQWDEVVRQLQTGERRLLEQMQELEEHAYLCLLTMNRARMILLQDLLC